MRPHQHPLSPEDPPDPLLALAYLEKATFDEARRADECADVVRGVPDPVVRQLAELQRESHMQAASVYAMLGTMVLEKKKRPRGMGAWVRRVWTALWGS